MTDGSLVAIAYLPIVLRTLCWLPVRIYARDELRAPIEHAVWIAAVDESLPLLILSWSFLDTAWYK